MIGKKIRLNDYKFTYGQDTIYINLYGAFKYTKNGNKYAVYSYENSNVINYGTFFVRNNEAVIMVPKEDSKDIITDFIDMILEEKESKKYEIIPLNELEEIQIIDEYKLDGTVDINKLTNLTIPKPVIEVHKEKPKKKKTVSIANIFFVILIIVIIAFFFFNPEVIIGKNKHYSCIKNYKHKNLPANVNEEIKLIFNGRGNITDINIISDYVFTDTNYYQEFKNKSYFYQFIKEGDTYKFEDTTYTYRLFSKIDLKKDYFLPEEEKELISYYEEKEYTCKRDEVNEQK